jgi:hypothetical protein
MIGSPPTAAERLLGVVPPAEETRLNPLIFIESHGPKLLGCDKLQLFADLRTETTKGPARESQ